MLRICSKWRGEQLIDVSRCSLNATTPQRESCAGALLMETGAQTSGSAAQAMDESLWFAGRPAVVIRSASSVTSGVWARQAADWSTSACTRRGQAADCQPYGIVSDYLPKPVATIDSARRVSGVLEYDPYGIVNRVSHWGEVAAALDNTCAWLAWGLSQGTSPLNRDLRTHVQRADLGPLNCIAQYKNNPPVQTDSLCAAKWNHWNAWQSVGDGETLHLLYCANVNGTPNPQPWGVTMDGYEYRKYEAGARHYLPPFRFPGQYYDAETGFHENWNRFYDPTLGRYLSPEPLLQNPSWVAARLRRGEMVPPYAYASNNPVARADRDGRLDGWAIAYQTAQWLRGAGTSAAGAVAGGAASLGLSVALWPSPLGDGPLHYTPGPRRSASPSPSRSAGPAPAPNPGPMCAPARDEHCQAWEMMCYDICQKNGGLRFECEDTCAECSDGCEERGFPLPPEFDRAQNGFPW